MTSIDDPLARVFASGGAVVEAATDFALDTLAFACYCSGMTNTAPSLPSDLVAQELGWVDVPLEQLEAEAEKIAAERGAGQATWLEISWESTARRILQLIADGDPVQDEYGPPAPLSGEWADGPTPDSLLRDDLDLELESVSDSEREVLVEAYEQRYYQAYWDAVEKRCRDFIAEEDAERAAEALAHDPEAVV